MTRFPRFSLAFLFLASALWSLPGPAAAAEGDVEQGAADFQEYCTACHGAQGRGDGPVAAVLSTPPADLTRIAERAGGTFSPEAVYAKIEGMEMSAAHGTSDMPVWGFWFTSEAVGDSILLDDARPAAERVRARISAIVSYLETIQE